MAPNIYFLGHAGVVNFGGLRIAGLSGIHSPHDYAKGNPTPFGCLTAPGHFETPPFNSSSVRSVYHTREEDVYKLSLLTGRIDMFLSHDWPAGIAHFGDLNRLLRTKPGLKSDVFIIVIYLICQIMRNDLGHPHAMDLLRRLQPSYWFAAHHHIKFPAIVPHGNGKVTKFLALDKLIPGRDFMQFLEIDCNPGPLCFDREWLSIVSAIDPFLTYSHSRFVPPSLEVASSYDYLN